MYFINCCGFVFCRSFLSLVFTGYVNLFSICCKAWLGVLNFLNLCLSVKFLISPLILNEIFAGYSNLGCRLFCSFVCFVFYFSTLNIPCHSLLACRVSTERSAVNHMGFPLYVTYCFSLAAFNILSVCLISVSLINGCLGVFLPGSIL